MSCDMNNNCSKLSMYSLQKNLVLQSQYKPTEFPQTTPRNLGEEVVKVVVQKILLLPWLQSLLG